ncbi:MAG: cytochrome c3 family protein [Candidatus Binatia bacterium]
MPISQLSCQGCHASTLADGTPVDPATYTPSCADCHVDVDNPSEGITDALCMGCHARQGAEANFFGDVHRDAGFTCTSCHTTTEIHGDGTEHVSMLETPGPQCEDCHAMDGEAGPIPTNTAHTIHADKVDCSACHVQSVVSCRNCHFESEVAGAGKRFFGPPAKDFKMLLNFRGKVYPATFQSLVFQGESFYVLAPYYAHTVTPSVACDDCHDNAAIREYRANGEITVTKYADGELQGPTGVIPIPPDWRTALQFDFLDYLGDPTTPIADTDPVLWQFLKTGADLNQMPYGTPLTTEQMNALALHVGSTK